MDDNKNYREEEKSPYFNHLHDTDGQQPNPYEIKDHRFGNGVVTGITISIIVVAILFGIAMLRGVSIGGMGSGQQAGTLNYEQMESKLSLLEQYIDKFYMDGTDSAEFQEGVYKGLISSLEDPYSTYYTKEEYDELKESSSGEYCGIGSYVNQDATTGIITIVKPFENGPAAKAGILAKDILYSVEGEEVTGKDLTEVVNKMKGKEGTTVHLEVLRGDSTTPIGFDVVRANIEVPTIVYKMMEDNIGYIQVTEFDMITSEQFKQALEDLNNQGMAGLVIDLRNNPGGLLTTVVEMLRDMVGEGMLVYTMDKNGVGEEFKAKDGKDFDKPLAVLINGYSASASEVFAGCIQDYGIGTLVGTTSFGKGIVQNIYPLNDGSAVKLTNSKYFTPKGRNIHGTGIEPDIKVELSEEAKGEISPDNSTDNQLKTAVDVVKAKIK